MSRLIASSTRTVVVGLGASGLSAARYLHRLGRPFQVADNRSQPPMLDVFRREYPDVSIALGAFREDQFLDVNQIILSPGLPRTEPAIARAIEAGIEVIGDIELFARAARAPIVAITGSNGKTTVTTLVAEMAKAAGIKVKAGGNLGTPALDLLDEKTELYVLEVSSFQLESTLRLGAAAATVLNVTADHMDRYPSLAHYHQAKQRIYFGAEAVVVNRDDMLTVPPVSDQVRQVKFGLREPDLKDYGIRVEEGVAWLSRGLENLLPVADVALRGRHNLANALAALALGEAAKIPRDAMLDCLRHFEGLPHRCQRVASYGGIEYINDSKATNVGATVAALEGLADDRENIVLIAGGDGKGADFSPLQPVLRKVLRGLVTIGRDGDQIGKLVAGELPVEKAGTMRAAVELATRMATAGDTVLLSPACASFDMFANYEDRGNQFISVVEEMRP